MVIQHTWAILVPLFLGAVAVYLLLPRPRPLPARWGAIVGAFAIMLAGWFLIESAVLAPEIVLFYAFSALAIISGTMLLTQRNPVHAALSFAIVVLSTCGLFLLQAAPFLMAATTIVYAGAIVVTFLFVIMLAQQAGLSSADQRSREPLFATVAGFVLLGALLYILKLTYHSDDLRALDGWLEQTRQFQGRINPQKAGPEQKSSLSSDARATLTDLDQFLARFKGWLGQGLKTSSDASENLTDAVAKAQKDISSDLARPSSPVDWPAIEAALSSIQDSGNQLRFSLASIPPSGEKALSAFSGMPSNTAYYRRPHDRAGSVPLPAENVDYLGCSLFSDYLLAVELAGTLLLVATIGAIAIAMRGREGLR